MTGTISVLATAAPILCQDVGRAGFSAIGVPRSGAFDRAAAALANRLVGNPASAAALEITVGHVRMRTDATVTCALAGAEMDASVAGEPVAVHEVFSWRAGTDATLGAARTGLRTYLAVRGGFDVAPVLGSASTDVLSGLGPRPLLTGDSIGLAGRRARDPVVGFAPVASPDPSVLRVLLGPRDSWFTAESIAEFGRSTFIVSPDSNRVGVRLSGRPLDRRRHGELPSEPLQRGAIQVPPNGLPIVMGPDHPTTGGYPVIATVIEEDWDLCAQLRPGGQVLLAIRDHV